MYLSDFSCGVFNASSVQKNVGMAVVCSEIVRSNEY